MTLVNYPSILTVDETMDVLRIGRSQCYALLHSGKLKAFKIGKKTWKISKESLEEYISTGGYSQ